MVATLASRNINMPITSEFVDDVLVIHVIGTLDSKQQKPFREAYMQEGTKKAIILDFIETEFIDSAGISLLIGLHTSMGRKLDARTQIVNASLGIKEILEISRLDKFFDMT